MPTKQNKKPTRSPAVKQPGTGRPAHSISISPAWERRLKELAAFKKEHGQGNVSTLDKRHASLGNWVRTQRGRRRRGQLSQEQIRILDELGFSWKVRQEDAEENLIRPSALRCPIRPLSQASSAWLDNRRSSPPRCHTRLAWPSFPNARSAHWFGNLVSG